MQVLVVATDGGRRTDNTTVTISVSRNMVNPTFVDVTNSNYNITIDNDVSISTPVYNTQATDSVRTTSFSLSCSFSCLPKDVWCV